MGGKRQANVLSALIQNFDTVEKVIETSANSAGSALEENERYLDSIQGKIDQFNNALQSMWSNALDDDFVKVVVALGTELVKILDTLKPISVLIAGIAVYFNKKYNIVDFSNLFAGFKESFANSNGPKDFFKNLISGFKNTEVSVEKAKEKLEELEEQRARLGDPKSEKNRKKVDTLDQEINSYKEMLAPSEDLIAAQNKLQAAQNRLANTKSVNPKTIQKYKREVEKAKLEVDNLTNAQKTSGQTGKTAFAGLGKSVKSFGKQVTSVVTQMFVMWAITKVIEILVKGFDDVITTAEEAAEAYEELNSELDTLKNNIADINDELSTLDDRIAELTAKGSLSFTEKEELERLRAEREELERTLELNQQLANQKQQQVNNQTSGQVEYYRNKGVKSGKTTGEQAASGALTGAGIVAGVGLATGAASAAGSAILGAKAGAALGTLAGPIGTAIGLAAGAVIGSVIGGIVGGSVGANEEKVGESIDNMEEKLAEKEKAVEKARAKYQDSGSDKDKEKYEKAQKALSDYRGEMAKYFTDLDAYYQNVDLSTIEDPDEYKRLKEEMNDFYNERDKWLITSGAEGAESNAIGRIFSKDDYENASKTIDNLVKKLEKDPTDQNAINQISELCKVAEEDLDAVGLKVKDATDYFTMMGQNAAFGTIEGKVAEISSATSKLQTLLSDTDSLDFTSLFGQGGEVSKTAIAEYFQGTSEETRVEIARLIKDINEDKISVENALKQFEYFGIESTIDIYVAEVQTNFKDVFVELEDADGLIDTFKELGDAINSTASALKVFNKAEAEMAYSGRVSIQTALELMEYTDDYGSILEVVDGKLQLVDNAEEALIQTRIDAIKTSAEASLSDATNAYSKAQLATQTYRDALTTDKSAEVVAKSWEKVLAAGAGLWEGIKSLLTEESWTEAYNRAYGETLSNMTGYEMSYDDAGLQALIDAEAEAKSAMESASERVELANQLTPETLEAINDADDVKDMDDVAEKALEKLQKKYERQIKNLENQQTYIENEIEKLEAEDKAVSKSYYEQQIDLEEQKIELYKQERAELLKLERTDEVAEQLWEVEHAIQESTLRMIEFRKSITQLYEEAFSDVMEAYGNKEEFNTDQQDYIDKYNNLRELKGENPLASGYRKQIEIEEGKMADNQDELNTLRAGLAQGMQDGTIKEGDDLWVKTQEDIRATEAAILDNKTAVEKYNQALTQLSVDKFNDVKEAFDNSDDFYSDQQSYIEKYQKLMELQGEKTTSDGYQELMDIETKKMEDNISELNGLRTKLADGIADGTIKEGSKEWVEMQDEIRATEVAILDNKIAVEEYQKALTQLSVDNFNDVKEAFDNSDDFYSDQQNYIERYQELMELQGQKPTATGYQELIDIENKKMNDNISERDRLLKKLNDGVADGTIEEGSEEWIKMQDEIRATEADILNNKIAVEKYNEAIKQLAVDAFKDSRKMFANKDQFLTNQQDYISGYIDQLEALGIDAPQEAFEELIQIEQNKRLNNVEDLQDARKDLEDIEAQGYTAADDEWQEAYQQVVKLEKGIQDNDIAIAKWQQTILDMDFSKLEEFLTLLKDVNTEVENLDDIVSREDAYNDDGTWTKAVITSLVLKYQNYVNSKQYAARYGEEIQKIDEAYANGTEYDANGDGQGEILTPEKYEEYRKKLVDGQWTSLKDMYSAKDEMIAMEEARIDKIEEAVNREVEAYSELIDVKKEELDAERDLYEFKKDVEGQTKDIAALERRIASLSGSTSAADIAERRKLETELYEKNEGLDDTYYNHSKDSQSKALDDEMNAFQEAKDKMMETLREGLENTEEIFKKLIGEVALNADVIGEEINDTAEKDGITLSDLLTSPWVAAGGAASTFKSNADTTLKDMIGEDGIITLFNTTATSSLANPFLNAATAETGPIAQFETAVTNAISNAQKKVNGEDGTQNYLGNSVGKPWADAAKEDGPIATFSDKVNTAIEDAKKKVNGEEGTQNYLGDGLGKPWSDAAAEDGPIATFSEKVAGVIKNAQEKVNGTEEDNKNYLGNGLTKPWEDATAEDSPINTFDDTVDSVINAAKKKVMGEDGTQNYLGNELAKPWETDAPNTFSSNVEQALNEVIRITKEKVAEINAETAKVKLPNYTGNGDTTTSNSNSSSGSNSNSNSTSNSKTQETAAQKRDKAIKAAQAYVDAKGFSEGDKARWGQDLNFRPLLQAVYAAGGTIDNLKGKVYAPKGNTTQTQQKATFKTTGSFTGVQIGEKAYNQNSEIKGSDGETYYPIKDALGNTVYIQKGTGYTVLKNGKIDIHSFKPTYKKYAKGTTGTTRDEWAITDESWIGEEITLAAGKNGQLQYLKKGSAVMPADISANLVEWGKLNPSMMTMGGVGTNLNVISNAVNKPEFNISFDSMVHVDHCDEGTLKNLEKMIDNKINDFSKSLNYSMKRFAR